MIQKFLKNLKGLQYREFRVTSMMCQKMKGKAISALILVLTLISVESYPTYAFNVRCYGIGKETLCIPEGLRAHKTWAFRSWRATFIPTPKIDDDNQIPRDSKRILGMSAQMAIDTTQNNIEASPGLYFLLQVLQKVSFISK